MDSTPCAASEMPTPADATNAAMLDASTMFSCTIMLTSVKPRTIALISARMKCRTVGAAPAFSRWRSITDRMRFNTLAMTKYTAAHTAARSRNSSAEPPAFVSQFCRSQIFVSSSSAMCNPQLYVKAE